MEKKNLSKGWLRLVAVLCTLLLAGSVFLVLGMTVWAQEQPTEQPAGTEQPAETTQQPAQTGQTVKEESLVIDYWEPQVGTKTVYYTNDSLNDRHGNIFGTSMLGYWDDAYLYSTRYSGTINYSSSYYKTVDALSDMNPVYFDLKGPWYFSMTTPFQYIEEVIGINEAPEAAQFPQATYAVRYMLIGSGGHRIWGTYYRTNDATQKKWMEWGYTMQLFPTGEEKSINEIVRYYSPSDKKTPVARTLVTFPLSVGVTGSQDAYYEEGAGMHNVTGSGAIEVVAEGQVTVPSGTYDALLMKANLTSPPNGERYSEIMYGWFVKDIGFVAQASSLPNEIGPLYETATDMMVIKSFALPGAAQQ